jgi:hypothetical protein
MKALFERKKKLIEELNAIGYQLDKKIDERWGFSYSETDDDEMIDTLDYGTSSINYATFVRKMNTYKKNMKKDGKYGVVS